ncbi:MAG: hypothetical protein E6H72_08835 [Betaproteobacteria bacterium]|nr:MAG: hypothetical protein E6H72_08835 [Betaproteobacteria bacterium]
MTDHRYLEDLENLSAKAKDIAAQGRARAIEEYWPRIGLVCRESVGPAAFKVARDDEKLTGIARAIYPALPLPLRLFVGESDFITFCLTNRDRLLLLSEHASGTSDKRESDAGAG